MSGRPDIAWSRQIAKASFGQLVLWTSAAALVVAAHGGAAWWVMRQPPAPPADPGTPVAIMIDLAPVAMAPAAEEEEIAPDDVDSVAAKAQPVEAEPEEPVPDEPEPVEPVEPEPVEPELAESVEPEVPQEQVEPVEPVEEVLPAVVNVPLPTPRPNRPPPKVAEKPRQPEKARPIPPRASPSRDATRAKVQAQQEASRAAAPQSNRGSSSMSPATWQSRVAARLNRHKRYPSAARKARQEGVVRVRFTFDGGGNVQSVALVASSGVAELDQEAVNTVRRASPIPAPPPGVHNTITVPMRFDLR